MQSFFTHLSPGQLHKGR